MSDAASFSPAPFFVFRTPLRPWDAFEAWTGLAQPPASEGDWKAGREALRRGLAEALERPEILEALFLASPDLVDALPKWREAPDSEKGARCERGLVRYFARLHGRATPFGLFAGCSQGRIGQATNLALGPREGYRRHTRLDMDYLCSLAEELRKDEALAASLLYRPNSSLYEAGGRLRYAEGLLKERSRSYQLVAVEPTPYLRETLRRAASGATLEALAEALVDEDVTMEEARAYLQELVQSQILVPELTPAVTGPEPMAEMIAHLAPAPGGSPAAAILGEVQDTLAGIDAGPLGTPLDPYRALAERLRQLPAKVELNRLFQSDLVKPAPEAELGEPLVREVQQTLALLHGLARRSGGRSGPLDRFRDAFRQRYEDREVPLVEALDEESGVGFGSGQGAGAEASPLLEGLAFPEGGETAGQPLGPLDAFLLRRLHAHPGDRVLRLDPKELEPFRAKAPDPLPASLSVVGQVIAGEGGPRFCFGGASGPSGANLLGRFCHGDEGLTEAVKAYLAAEEAHAPEACFAEVVHLPEGRIGNVLLRPLLRGYEIPYLGRSGAPEDRQIPLTDLMISARGGRLVLRSRRLDREVRPRLSTAHNYTFRSLGVYRFLCQLAHEGTAGGVGWSWGALEAMPFLPRVEIGGTVVSVARWGVEGKALKAAAEAEGWVRWEAFQAWRKGLDLPARVYLVDGDNRLPLDLDNPLLVDSFLDLVKGRPALVIEEFFPEPGQLAGRDSEGRYVHEVVIPMTAALPERGAEAMPAPQAASVPRTFLPGSEWLFLKLYGGPAALDQVLREDVAALVDDLKASGAVDGWFFIRYGDPDWHLRLRFHGEPRRLLGEVLPAVSARVASLQRQGLIRTLAVDTYGRELERYGGDAGMALSERLFQLDSEAVLELLQAYPGDAGADARWRLALRGMDDLLDGLGLDPSQRLELMRNLRGGFLKEFGGPGPLERMLGARYRKDRAAIGQVLDAGTEVLSEGLAILARRREALAPIGEALRDCPGLVLPDLAGSYLHMHVNRLLRGAHRAQELVLYDFLHRHYESQLARQRKAQPVG